MRGSRWFVGTRTGRIVSALAAVAVVLGTVSVARAADTSAPTVPMWLHAALVTAAQVDLVWSPSRDNVGVSGYDVYRGGVKVATVPTASFTDLGAPSGATASYTVAAADAAGNHSAQSPALSVSVPPSGDANLPDAPGAVSVSATSWHEVDLSWTAGSDDVAVQGYRVYRYDAGSTDRTLLGTTPQLFFDDASAQPSSSYTYAVVTVDEAGNESAEASTTATTGDPVATPIQHVVVIDQENHTFDDTLGKLCADIAAGTITRSMGCDGATSGQISTGATIPLTQEPDVVPNINHSILSQKKAIDGGKMDGFNLNKGCTSSSHYACYAQYDPSQIPNLAALATTYAISDRTFQSSISPSWGGHLTVVAATLDGFDGGNPVKSKFTSKTGPGWGCDSYKDDKWWNGSSWVSEPSCIPDAWGNGPYRPSPVASVPTIMDRFDASGMGWRIYGSTGGSKNNGSGWGWSICPAFFGCLGSPERDHLVNATQVLADAKAGALPAYSIVTPTTTNSQHNTQSMAVGDNWIGSIVSAIQAGPDWASTAIFITYDDCGCFYDHVPPPNADLGIRMPMVIVSPYAKAGYTDSNVASFSSILAFTEHTFGLTPLSAADAAAYDYANAFDYTQAPTAPVVRMTRTRISKAERRYIAAHPDRADDPT